MPPWMTEQVIVAMISGAVALLVALIGLLGKIIFDLGKTKKDAAAARHASEKTENSINNRPTSLSDRLDGVLRAVGQVQQTQRDHGTMILDNTDDIKTISGDITSLQDKDRELRRSVKDVDRKLTKHTNETAVWTPMLDDLHTKYVEEKNNKRK